MVKDFLVSSILDPISLLFPNTYGLNLGLYRKFLTKSQKFLKPKYKKSIKVLKFYPCEGPEGQPATLQPYVIDVALNLIEIYLYNGKHKYIFHIFPRGHFSFDIMQLLK